MKRKDQLTSAIKKKHILAISVLLTGMCILFSTVHLMRHSTVAPETLSELLNLPEDKLARVDIARMNLLCATGLPNSEDIKLNDYLLKLDGWAEVVKKAEQKYLPTFYKNPARYENSLSKFKAITLALTIQEDLKCKYNMELVRSGIMQNTRQTKFFRDSRDLFVHGLIERRTGTCSSLPVLIVILGRRCGYPLYLVTSKGHLFCRWQDSHEAFNIEAASRGVDIYQNSHYRTFPYPFTDKEMNSEKYLKTLAPVEELGVFMNNRGLCLQEHNLFRQALDAYSVSLRGFPNSTLTRAYIDNVKRRN
jgi:regulator of sirC expression with transglutaminase-like and TPR domain